MERVWWEYRVFIERRRSAKRDGATALITLSGIFPAQMWWESGPWSDFRAYIIGRAILEHEMCHILAPSYLRLPFEIAT